VFYPKPLHLQDCFAELGYRPGDLPAAEKLCDEGLSLPVYPDLSPEQIEHVAGIVLKHYGTS
jgi:dTDP-4-amino-4,6-dideoxygalactose transaminase